MHAATKRASAVHLFTTQFNSGKCTAAHGSISGAFAGCSLGEPVGVDCLRSEGYIRYPGHRRARVSRFQCEVSFRPVMNAQDLAKAAPSIGKAVEQYGK